MYRGSPQMLACIRSNTKSLSHSTERLRMSTGAMALEVSKVPGYGQEQGGWNKVSSSTPGWKPCTGTNEPY